MKMKHLKIDAQRIDLPGTRVIVSVFECQECANIFFVEQEPTQKLKCPRLFCGNMAEKRKDFSAFFREELPDEL